MDAFEDLSTERLRDATGAWLTDDHYDTLSNHPLDGVDTEYPHHAGHVTGPDDRVAPRERHPVFFGCFDWHSAVHSHWALVRALRLADTHPGAGEITGSIDARLTRDAAETEAVYLADNPHFERPYGWAWLLRLAAELDAWDDPRADRWRDALSPLETQAREHVEDHLLTRERPNRVGTHGNTAFALDLVLDYARHTGDDALETAVASATRRLYADDSDYSLAFEPLGWDFHSPGLTEAALVSRVLPTGEFADWLDAFLASPVSDRSLAPAGVDADETAGMALHLVGLNLSRARSLYALADATGEKSPRALADEHARVGLSRAFTDAYAGSHWLSSFALHLLTRDAD